MSAEHGPIHKTAEKIAWPGMIGGAFLLIAGLTTAGILAVTVGGGSYWYERKQQKKAKGH